jgi:hypothetical protein
MGKAIYVNTFFLKIFPSFARRHNAQFRDSQAGTNHAKTSADIDVKTDAGGPHP